MPNENEGQNQPEGQLLEDSAEQSQGEPQQELDPFERVLSSLPEEDRKVVREGYLRDKDYRKKTQNLSREKQGLERREQDLQQAKDFYDRFTQDKNFAREVYKGLNLDEAPEKQSPDKSWDEVQETLSSLDPTSRKAIEFLIDKKVQSRVNPLNDKISAYERERQQRDQARMQRTEEERRLVLQGFQKNNPDYIDVESEMMDVINDFPNFFQQSPAKLSKNLERVYDFVSLPRRDQKNKEAGIKQMLEQSSRAQKQAAAAPSKSSPQKTYKPAATGKSIDEVFNDTWSEFTGE